MEQCPSLGVSRSDGGESPRETQEPENDSPTILPNPAPETDESLTSQDMPETQTLHAEQFRLLDPNGQPIQYDLQSLGDSNTQMMIAMSPSENGQVLHVIPSSQTGMAQVIIPQEPPVDVTSPQDASEEKPTDRSLPAVRADTLEASTNDYILRSQASLVFPKKSGTRMLEEILPAPLQPLSCNTPIWACRLRSCEKIGDSYRGYCVSETELESILTFHKQQTRSVWGTRQSPSPAKPATRLMWKSQYVPYDGIPFVNAGSRAVVMECQYGPRRKGFQLKRISEQESRSCHLYKATCPARWYVQLPTQQAHQYHELETRGPPLSPAPFPASAPEEEETVVRDENSALPSRLHPQVAHKIQELVSQGVGHVYAVRKQLRKFVERELFKPDEIPERHNLSFFPTVNDIKNHIHEVQKSLRTGEVVYHSEVIPAMLQWTTDSGNILRETVTVTFAEGHSLGEPVASSVGARGSQTSLSSAPCHLLSPLSSLQPKIFSHSQGLKLQPRLSSPDGSQALVSGTSHPSSSPSGLVDTAGNAVVNNHSLLLGQSQSLRTDPCLTQNNSAVPTMGNLPESVQNLGMDQLVEVEDVEDAGDLEGSVNRILLGDVQTVPIGIVDSHPALRSLEDSLSVNQVKQEPKEPTLPMGTKTFQDCKKLPAT